tara:strand:- start:1491 stop:1922 length:432 start_codon:yes stop_codon:yes gene_type:complete
MRKTYFNIKTLTQAFNLFLGKDSTHPLGESYARALLCCFPFRVDIGDLSPEEIERTCQRLHEEWQRNNKEQEKTSPELFVDWTRLCPSEQLKYLFLFGKGYAHVVENSVPSYSITLRNSYSQYKKDLEWTIKRQFGGRASPTP